MSLSKYSTTTKKFLFQGFIVVAFNRWVVGALRAFLRAVFVGQNAKPLNLQHLVILS